MPQSVKQSIEQKINAEQDAQKMQFVLQKEQQEAQRKRIDFTITASFGKPGLKVWQILVSSHSSSTLINLNPAFMLY